ncbi:MAG: hypothetical protein N3D09_04955 [Archaeoglobaceae archaeon]|nr:hypothetical protein [Archaeoglobaceae archaeon]
MIRKITFPPILLFIVILVLGAIVNIVATTTESDQSDSELYMLQITAMLDKEKLTNPGRISVTLTVDGAQRSSYAVVYVYDPENRLFAVKEGKLNDGFAIFEIWFGLAVKQGNYTIIPGAGLSKSKIVLGTPVVVEIKYGG